MLSGRYRWQTAGGTLVESSFTLPRTGVQGDVALELKEEIPDMALLDLMVDANFRSEPSGRVVIFPGDRPNRGYVLKLESEELKIRGFLKMFYFAHLSILLLGCLLAFASSWGLGGALGGRSGHLLRIECIFVGIYCLVAGVPYWLLWRSYKKAFASFVSVEDEVVLSGNGAGRRLGFVIAGLIALGTLALLAAIPLFRGTSFAK
jgi:hypothetical protein